VGRTRKGDTLGIGEFALLTGISIPALRHYHEVGLLVPCDVDRWTGYRRYRLRQARVARIIRTLRALEMPLEEVATCSRRGRRIERRQDQRWSPTGRD
jgi:DNA-binding transcriptional MerR regulator